MMKAWNKPPNGLASSCRERARQSLSKSNALAREAVGCNAVFARNLGGGLALNRA